MKAEEKIYEAYLKSKNSKLYFNQLKELTKLSNSSLQNVLNRLTKDKILLVDKKISNTFYRTNNKKLFSLKFSEIALKHFDKLDIEIKAPLKSFIEQVSKEIFTIVLFGSSSINQQKEGSDIDLLVVSNSNNNFENIKKEVNSISNYPLSIFKCSVKQFYDNKDHVIIQARKTGFPIYKEQSFYEVILDEY